MNYENKMFKVKNDSAHVHTEASRTEELPRVIFPADRAEAHWRFPNSEAREFISLDSYKCSPRKHALKYVLHRDKIVKSRLRQSFSSGIACAPRS